MYGFVPLVLYHVCSCTKYIYLHCAFAWTIIWANTFSYPIQMMIMYGTFTHIFPAPTSIRTITVSSGIKSSSTITLSTIVTKSYVILESVRSSVPFRVCVCLSQILHPTCSAYISWNNGRILMFKVSKWPYQSSWHDEIICRWRHNPPGGENLN